MEDKEEAEKFSNANGRAWRGGSFSFGAPNVRSAARLSNRPVNQNSDYGFRVARTYR